MDFRFLLSRSRCTTFPPESGGQVLSPIGMEVIPKCDASPSGLSDGQSNLGVGSFEHFRRYDFQGVRDCLGLNGKGACNVILIIANEFHFDDGLFVAFKLGQPFFNVHFGNQLFFEIPTVADEVDKCVSPIP